MPKAAAKNVESKSSKERPTKKRYAQPSLVRRDRLIDVTEQQLPATP